MNLLALCWTLLTFSSGLVSLLICVDLSVSLSAKFVFSCSPQSVYSRIFPCQLPLSRFQKMLFERHQILSVKCQSATITISSHKIAHPYHKTTVWCARNNSKGELNRTFCCWVLCTIMYIWFWILVMKTAKSNVERRQIIDTVKKLCMYNYNLTSNW